VAINIAKRSLSNELLSAMSHKGNWLCGSCGHQHRKTEPQHWIFQPQNLFMQLQHLSALSRERVNFHPSSH